MLQPGRLQDLEMYATASAGKHNLVSRLEATPIDYKAEDFLERVRLPTFCKLSEGARSLHRGFWRQTLPPLAQVRRV
jgi:hypothetical protein